MKDALRSCQRPRSLAFLLIFFFVACARFGGLPPPELPEKASPAQLRKDVEFLADQKLEGRGLGTKGLEKAARYLLQRFSELGLESVSGSYFESFDAVVAMRPGVRTTLGFAKGAPQTPQAGPGEQVIFTTLNDDYIPASFSSEGDFRAKMVFAGYCASAPGYDDFHGLDAKGKAVVCLRGNPPGLSAESAGTGQYAADRYKTFNAREHGAGAVFLVSRGLDGRKKAKDLPQMAPSPLQGEVGLPVYYLSRPLAERLFKLAGVGSLIVIEQRMAHSKETASVPLESIEAGGQVELIRETQSLPNVVGLLRAPGGGSETLVVGAHYDHLGFGGEGSMDPGKHAVHPGADDNASGVAAILEIARLLSGQREKLRRNILFAAFAGEESGLLGSAKFVESRSEAERKKIDAMVNFDMVGRLDPKKRKLMVFGANSGEGLAPYLEKLAQGSGLELEFAADAYGPSDHTSFLAREIPAIHFFTGAHSDYHRPSDTAEKLNYEGEAQVVDLAARLVLALAMDRGSPRFLEASIAHPTSPAGDPAAAAPGYGPYLGSVPDFGEVEGGGVRFAGIRPGSPADVGGVKVGDILVKFGGQEIRNLYDFTFALRSHAPGDKVEVYVRRSEKIVRLQVVLTERP